VKLNLAKTRFVFLILALIGFVVYGNMLGNQFVDDDAQLKINPLFHSLSSIPQLFLKGDKGVQNGGYYRPLSDSIFTVEYSLFNTNPIGYHVIQLGLHISVSFLVFLVFKKFFSKKISLFLALVFLVHPINTEAVSYISAFRENLFVLFGLSALLVNRPPTIFIFLLLSLLSKETGIIFLVLLPIYKHFNQRDIFNNIILVTFGTIATYGIFRLISRVNVIKKAIVPIQTLGFWDRMLQVPQIVIYYIKNLIYPVNLISNQAWTINKITFNNFYLPLLIEVVLLIVLVWWLVKYKSKSSYFFTLWFVLALGVHLQIVPLDVTVADRWFYAPMIGLLGLFGIFIEKFKTLNIYVFVTIIFFLSVLTVVRNDKWHDNLKLISNDYTVSKNEDYLLEKRYGTELMINNQLDMAIIHLKKANKLFPQNYGVWNNLGNIYLKTGYIDEAIEAYQMSINNDNYYGAYQNLVYLLIKHKDIPKAESFITKGLSLYPEDETLWYYQIVVQLKLNDIKKATYAAEKYYLLSKSEEAFTIYNRLIQSLPVSINLN
jgi:protein O-mannosyl-transferase